MQIFKRMEKFEFHVLIKYCFLMEKNIVQANEWLDQCYLDSAPLVTMFKRWYADFKRGCTDTNDTECSSHPNSAVVPENTKTFYKIILASRKSKLCKIAEDLKISVSIVFSILHEHLSMRKLCLLTVDQKQCVDDSKHGLQLFQCNKKKFLHK